MCNNKNCAINAEKENDERFSRAPNEICSVRVRFLCIYFIVAQH